jgi:hypothetical protein
MHGYRLVNVPAAAAAAAAAGIGRIKRSPDMSKERPIETDGQEKQLVLTNSLIVWANTKQKWPACMSKALSWNFFTFSQIFVHLRSIQ